jgi:hypothetical protein
MVALVRSEGLLMDVTGLGTTPCQNGKDYWHSLSDNVCVCVCVCVYIYIYVRKLLPNITKLYHFKSVILKGIWTDCREVSSLVISLVLPPQYDSVTHLTSDDFPGLLTNRYKYMSHHIWAHSNESNIAVQSPTHLPCYESNPAQLSCSDPWHEQSAYVYLGPYRWYAETPSLSRRMIMTCHL